MQQRFSSRKQTSSWLLAALCAVLVTLLLSFSGLAVASQASALESTPTRVADRAGIEVLEFSPRVWTDSSKSDVTLHLLVKNNSPHYLRTPKLTVSLTSSSLTAAKQRADWLAATEHKPVTVLSSISLPSMFATSEARVKVTLPRKQLEPLLSKPGIYGLSTQLSVRSLSNISYSAKASRTKVTQYLQSLEADGSSSNLPRPAEMGVSRPGYSFEPTLPLPLEITADTSTVGDSYQLDANTLLPSLAGAKDPQVDLTVLTRLEFEAADLQADVPAQAASARAESIISASSAAGINLLLDPALLEYSRRLLPDLANVSTDGLPTADQIKSFSTVATVSPTAEEAAPSAVPTPVTATETTEGLRAPIPEEPSALAHTKRELLGLAHQVTLLPSGSVALLPWSSPHFEGLATMGIEGELTAARSLQKQADWLRLLSSASAQPTSIMPLVPLSSSDPQLLDLLAKSSTGINLLAPDSLVRDSANLSAGQLKLAEASGPVPTLIINSEVSRTLQTASKTGGHASSDFNNSQLFLAALADSARASQSLAVTVPASPASIIRTGEELKELTKTQDWIRLQTLNQSLPKQPVPPITLSEGSASTATVEAVDADTLRVAIHAMQRIEKIAAILDEPHNLLNPVTDALLLQLNCNAEVEPGLAAWEQSLQPWYTPVQLTAPKSVLMIYGESTLPVAVQNQLPWPVTATFKADSSSPRLQSPKTTEAQLPPSSGSTVNLSLNGVGSGDIRTQISVYSSANEPVAQTASIIVRVRADWETRGLFVLGGIALAVFIFGLWRRIRMGRPVASKDFANVKQFHDL
ncbi:DUF6049 family protein [Boudabousia marimammalium]|uniref:DUF6049 family protein n=1 Tax=Boudabousia marimammalium TaxID=156892 RepID=UPI001FEB4410|nr:DUF6049 family protein [Boudabousia marimammalium]